MNIRAHSLLCSLCAIAGGASSVGAEFAFNEVGSDVGIGPNTPAEGMGSGVAVADYDNDGFADIFLPQAAGVPNRLYRNLGNGTFVDTAASVGLDSLDATRVALWLDYDGDHDLDLFVATDDPAAASSYRLFRQEADSMFTDVTDEAGVSTGPVGSIPLHHRGGITAGDINRDGYLDIFTGRWRGPQHLFLNNGDGSFSDISLSSGVAATGLCFTTDGYCHVHQPMMADFNDDGWLDIYVAVDFDANILWINQQDNTFVNMAAGTGLDNDMNDMGMTLGDYDNDGDLDVYVTNVFLEAPHPNAPRNNILLRNDSVGASLSFVDVSFAATVENGYWGWGATFVDGESDCDLDIAATNGWRSGEWLTDPSRLFINAGGGTLPFTDGSTATGFDDTYYGSALVAADLDRDGHQDLIQVCMDGPVRILMGETTSPAASLNNYLVVKPRSSGSNYYSIGAIVRVQANGQSMMRLITAGTSYMGQEPAEAFFGLGLATVADTVTVEWPNGMVTTLNNVPGNQTLTVLQTLPIPTTTTWGLVVMTLLLLTAATAVFSKL